MTEPTGPNSPPQPLPPLDYARPAGVGLPRGVQLTLGVILALAVVMPLTVFGPIVAGLPGAFLGPLFGIAIVGAIAYIFRQYETRRTWAAGIWIGVGIAVLVDGVCWLSLSRMGL